MRRIVCGCDPGQRCYACSPEIRRYMALSDDERRAEDEITDIFYERESCIDCGSKRFPGLRRCASCDEAFERFVFGQHDA